MKNKLKPIAILSLIFVVLITVTTVIIYSQSSSSLALPVKQQGDEVNVPVASLNELLPDNPKEKVKREKKNKKRNLKFASEGQGDSKRFMLTDKSQSSYGSFSSHDPAEPAIPAKQSDAVIIAEVKDAKAYLTEDKTSIYSEFTVNAIDILKNTTAEEINFGNLVTVSRGGGALRFPSGKTIVNLFDGKPMPRIGRKYIFFLKYDNEVNDFSIITAYEVKQEQIIPLDGLQQNGTVVQQLAAQQSYSGSSELDFVSQVREAIANNSDVFQGRGQ
ncbi:MAG: hypothetical protein ACR2MG_16360 [Pyrinomonadaceae bacterium]